MKRQIAYREHFLNGIKGRLIIRGLTDSEITERMVAINVEYYNNPPKVPSSFKTTHKTK
jgi:hypothetical protein